MAYERGTDLLNCPVDCEHRSVDVELGYYSQWCSAIVHHACPREQKCSTCAFYECPACTRAGSPYVARDHYCGNWKER